MARMVLSVFVGCLSAIAVGQEPPPVGEAAANKPAEIAAEAAEKPEPQEGLWPSPRLMKLMLQRWVEEACEEYDLDAQQRETVRKEAVDRWQDFLTENRAEIQPLVNEFIEMRMDLTPPDAPRVTTWAQRTAPVFEKTREQIHQSHDDFRKVLRPMQRAKFEVDVLKMDAGMAVAELKLKQWSQGQVDQDIFWEPLPAERRTRREERRRRRESAQATDEARSAAAEPIDHVAAELDRWEQYVADFIEMFNLDEGQKTTALSCLAELKGRALAHRDHRREDIARLERRIETFTGDAANLEELKKQLAELYGPIDEMFKELQARLGGIPTTEQRAGASDASKEKASTSPDSPAPKPQPPEVPPG